MSSARQQSSLLVRSKRARLLLCVGLCMLTMYFVLHGSSTRFDHGTPFDNVVKGPQKENSIPTKRVESTAKQSQQTQQSISSVGDNSGSSSDDVLPIDEVNRQNEVEEVAEPTTTTSSSGEKHHVAEGRLLIPKTTVVTMSYPKSSRFHVLVQIINKAIAWPFVEKVLLVWNGKLSELPPKILDLRDNITLTYGGGDPNKVKSRFEILPQEMNRVDNRWRIGKYIPTPSVLNMDDDIDLSEDGARCLLSVWQSSPLSIVGIDVRSHFHHFVKSKGKDHTGPHGDWGYSARDTSDGFKSYSISLPRALVTNKVHYFSYDKMWSEPHSKLKALVDELLCDDIAFNFVAMNGTNVNNNGGSAVDGAARHTSSSSGNGASVIYAKAKYRAYPESHKGAMFQMPGMKAKRQKCVNRLSEDVFGGKMPLLPRKWHVLCEVDG